MSETTRPPCWAKWATGGNCVTPATHRVRAGCVHEHVIEGFVCDKHVDDLRNSQVNCVTCYDLDQHVCPLLARVEALEPAA